MRNTKMKLKFGKFKHNWSRESTNDNLAYREIAAYTGAGLGQNLWWGLKGYTFVFYTMIMGLGTREIGLLILCAGIWDAINDPIMGMLIDKSNSKYGKLKPFLLISALPLGILTILTLYNPRFLDTAGKLIYVAVVYILREMFYTLWDVPFYALPGVITSNKMERTKLITVTQYGANIGLVLPGTLPFFLGFFDPSMHGTIYTVAAIVFGLLGTVLFGTAFFSIKEKVPPQLKRNKMLASFKVVAKSKPTLLMYSSTFLEIIEITASSVAYFFFFFAFLDGTGIKFIDNMFAIPGLGIMSVLGVVMGVPTFIAMAFTPKISKYVSMKNIYLFACVLRASSLFIAFMIGFDSPWKLILIIVMFMIANIPQDMSGIARKNLFLDSIDYLEWRTGKRVDGLVFSLSGFMVKIKFALATAVTGTLLFFVGLDTKVLEGLEGEEYTSKLYALKDSINIVYLFALYTLIPGLGKLLSALPIFFYDFVGDKKTKILDELKIQRAERAAALGLDSASSDIEEEINI